jgi:hypothetical protein
LLGRWGLNDGTGTTATNSVPGSPETGKGRGPRRGPAPDSCGRYVHPDYPKPDSRPRSLLAPGIPRVPPCFPRWVAPSDSRYGPPDCSPDPAPAPLYRN